MRRGSVDDGIVRRILALPEQRLPVRPGETCYNRASLSRAKPLSFTALSMSTEPAEVVTVHSTSRVGEIVMRQQGGG